MKPTVSIIVPVYNVEKYLKRCIDSILSQTFNDFELILIDDGSPDDSGRICDDYAASDGRVKVIHKPNAGVSAARNSGLDVAIGEYITFIDSDDWVEPGYLQELLRYSDYDYVIGSYVNEPSQHKGFQYNAVFDVHNLSGYVRNEYLHNGYPWGKLFRKSLIEERGIRFINIKVYEDLIFCLTYTLHCSSISLIPVANYHYYNPIEKWIPQKFPLTAAEVINLYKTSYSLVDAIARKFKAKPVVLSFSFLTHYCFFSHMVNGNDNPIFEIYRQIHPLATKEDFYADEIESPIRVLTQRCVSAFRMNDMYCCYRAAVLLKRNYDNQLAIRFNPRQILSNVFIVLVKYRCYAALKFLSTCYVSLRTLKKHSLR